MVKQRGDEYTYAQGRLASCMDCAIEDRKPARHVMLAPDLHENLVDLRQRRGAHRRLTGF